MAGKPKDPQSYQVEDLGPCKIQSPLVRHKQGVSFVSDRRRIIMDLDLEQVTKTCDEKETPGSLELAGPRSKIPGFLFHRMSW